MAASAGDRRREPLPTVVDDKDAIRELLAEYCFHLDEGRFAEMAALFTEDGTWDTTFGKAVGPAAIAAPPARAPCISSPISSSRSTASGPRRARTGRSSRTAPPGRKSARAAPTSTTSRRRPGAGASATARSTALSPREFGPT